MGLGSNPCFRAAHEYADRGWWVFPVRGKRPLPRHGFHDATREHRRIDRWWKRWPQAGVAIATGRVSGFSVLDIDGPAGEESIGSLTQLHGSLPDTPTVRTPGGGWHLYLDAPELRSTVGRLGNGLDTRGNGGYVVAPPSPHPDGGIYTWHRRPNRPLASAPQWLTDLLTRPHNGLPTPAGDLPDSGRRLERYVEAAVEAECRELAQARPGTRNDSLNRAAFALGRFVAGGQAPPEYVARRLAHAAAVAGLGPVEIARTLRSAFSARSAA